MKKHYSIIIILALGFVLISATVAKIRNVLIIGDSISIGYTPFVQTALAPEVIVEHNPGNGGSTGRGIQRIEEWIGTKQWDVILFNFGLHDMVRVTPERKYDTENGKISVSLQEYRENLVTIVHKLKETTATIIFINTTMVPENAIGRKSEDPEKYNQVALEVMKENSIQVVDLYTPSLKIHPENSNPGNVHYTEAGYIQLADYIVRAIKTAIK